MVKHIRRWRRAFRMTLVPGVLLMLLALSGYLINLAGVASISGILIRVLAGLGLGLGLVAFVADLRIRAWEKDHIC